MDQLASACGVEGAALLIDLKDDRAPLVTPCRLPDDIALVVCDTCEKHQLSSSGYRDRRRESEEAAQVLGVASLRDADMELLDRVKPELGDLRYRRAKHVVTENLRCQAFAQALVGRDYQEMGSLLAASHQSLKDDYEVTTEKLDQMVATGQAIDGCVGIRMTGGGFGGACIALVRSSEVESFCNSLKQDLKRRYGWSPELISCQAVSGAAVAS